MAVGRKTWRLKLADLIDQIRTRYSLGYRRRRSNRQAKFCEIKLKVSKDVLKGKGKWW